MRNITRVICEAKKVIINLNRFGKEINMGKIFSWMEAVIANNRPYATMAGVDIKKSADRLFGEDASVKTEKKDEKENGESLDSRNCM